MTKSITGVDMKSIKNSNLKIGKYSVPHLNHVVQSSAPIQEQNGVLNSGVKETQNSVYKDSIPSLHRSRSTQANELINKNQTQISVKTNDRC